MGGQFVARQLLPQAEVEGAGVVTRGAPRPAHLTARGRVGQVVQEEDAQVGHLLARRQVRPGRLGAD